MQWWRRLVDDFRTLIASGFALPILNWRLPSQKDPSGGPKAVDVPQHRTVGEHLDCLCQSVRPDSSRIGEPRKDNLADQADPSESSKAANGLNGAPRADLFRSRRAAEPVDISPVCLLSPPECPQILDTPEKPIGAEELSRTAQTHQSSTRRSTEPDGKSTFQEPSTVSRVLMERYNREELYEKVWTMPVRKVAEQYGVAHTTLGRTLKRLHIPVPADGYRRKNAANKAAGARPPLPAVQCSNGQTGGTESRGAAAKLAPRTISRRLLVRYNREELYERVWTIPLHKVAEEYAVSRSTMVETCKRLHIPAPSFGYWSKKAANKPVPVKPPLPEVLGPMSQIALSEAIGVGTVQELLTVSAGLMSRYNREELYEKAWTVPMLTLAKEYGVSNEALGKTCRKLYVPVPAPGYWQRKWANRPVDPKPPLPQVQIRVGRGTIHGSPQVVGESMHRIGNRESDGPSVASYSGAENSAQASGSEEHSQPLTVSRILISRYDRQDLYDRIWSVPMFELAKELGISDCSLSERCKRLCIPVPGQGYWQKKRANKPIEPRPPLPKVQIR